MKRKKNKANSTPSAVLLHARLKSGAGIHVKQPTRSAAKRQAIQENS